MALLLVSACGFPGNGPHGSPRDPDVPISSIALFEQSRLEGDWREVAGYPRGSAAAGVYRITSGGAAISGPGRYLPVRGRAPLRRVGPGRLEVGREVLWVLWVDADYRTLVLGSPDGQIGAVLNRGGPISSDRLEAARRVLDFNGYDLSRLEVL
ncbi:lipocalin family protein [Frigidibacter sp. ROC022]|uniref:lipocalin family protein n=1 Tax=Frigidibacter sp. ROC022 TaxID=2971796 RepID=UPI00215A0F65|nr:lipocalin family protein [Frigidibacter sp. ROC022]MCR8723668.1 lipocalin family protein [Frigidibacter sp. ROC022]